MIHIYSDPPDMERKLLRVISMLGDNDILIFTGDGVLNSLKTEIGARILYLQPDLKARGIEIKPGSGKSISLSEMVDLVAGDHKSPVSW
jgi:sulfur transfer complex TusBCD TusB component (DsrH family)